MAQAISRKPLTAEAQVRSQESPCEICGGESGIGTGIFFPECLLLPLAVSSHQCSMLIIIYIFFYQKNKRTKPGNHTKAVFF